MADATARAGTGDLLERLETAAAEHERAERAVDVEGEPSLRAVAETYDEFIDFIDENDGEATGSGRDAFRAYVAFQDELVTRIERLPDDLLAREAFEHVGELLDKRRLSPADMDRARDALEPAAEKASLLDDRRDARQRYRRARTAVSRRRREVESAIEEREQLLEYTEIDLDADLGKLRDPVAAYNDAVQDAFRSFTREASARSVLDLLDAATDYPLVELAPAPDRLAAYLRRHPVGEEPLHRLVELADYSTSKLAHYVDDADRFRAIVATNRTYLERLDAGPLTVDWPPPEAGQFRYRARELVAIVDRFADDSTVAKLHELRALSRDPEYEALRAAAVATDRLTADERKRLRTGAIERELAELREERRQLDSVLKNHQQG